MSQTTLARAELSTYERLRHGGAAYAVSGHSRPSRAFDSRPRERARHVPVVSGHARPSRACGDENAERRFESPADTLRATLARAEFSTRPLAVFSYQRTAGIIRREPRAATRQLFLQCGCFASRAMLAQVELVTRCALDEPSAVRLEPRSPEQSLRRAVARVLGGCHGEVSSQSSPVRRGSGVRCTPAPLIRRCLELRSPEQSLRPARLALLGFRLSAFGRSIQRLEPTLARAELATCIVDVHHQVSSSVSGYAQPSRACDSGQLDARRDRCTRSRGLGPRSPEQSLRQRQLDHGPRCDAARAVSSHARPSRACDPSTRHRTSGRHRGLRPRSPKQSFRHLRVVLDVSGRSRLSRAFDRA